jgi:hypothetical protein
MGVFANKCPKHSKYSKHSKIFRIVCKLYNDCVAKVWRRSNRYKYFLLSVSSLLNCSSSCASFRWSKWMIPYVHRMGISISSSPRLLWGRGYPANTKRFHYFSMFVKKHFLKSFGNALITLWKNLEHLRNVEKTYVINIYIWCFNTVILMMDVMTWNVVKTV